MRDCCHYHRHTIILISCTVNGFITNNYILSGFDFRLRIVDIDGKKIKLLIRDTASHERFKPMLKPYYKDALVSCVPHKDTIIDSCPAMYHI